jgi:hypothetical protein
MVFDTISLFSVSLCKLAAEINPLKANRMGANPEKILAPLISSSLIDQVFPPIPPTLVPSAFLIPSTKRSFCSVFWKNTPQVLSGTAIAINTKNNGIILRMVPTIWNILEKSRKKQFKNEKNTTNKVPKHR